jgi:general nucleoside transport system permease protein
MDVFYQVMQSTMLIAMPLMIVALGGLFSERSGVTNIALEGIMLIGGFFGIWAVQILERSFTLNNQLIYFIAIVVAAIFGALFSMLHAFASINMKANQIISATALNIFAVAFVIFVARSTQRTPEGLLTGGSQISFNTRFLISEFPLLSKIPFIGNIFFTQMFQSFFIGIFILGLTIVVINYTKFGLRLRACGENPHAADSLGINIYKMRFIAVMISGALAGIGGAIFTANTLTEYAPTMVGLGFLAIAVLIFGNWKPGLVFFAAMFFALLRVLGQYYNNIPFLANIGIPEAFYRMSPYIATLIVLSILSKSSRAPKALGQIYDKAQR